ncbi:MAG: outer membrane lipoprotein-sorting protein [Sulfurovum sp.]|nr:outer membrane lipoprotein-sorting protein [Sulfurovum sp.]MCB4753554.1 outer membrane lipoprotein-sorting protein [Sulfurovum sp.]MCB4761687.1 outer membrane lipoprotein-sorting protein [Sulfurovum sp.]MCB4764837.1 outer membrane lipoprotein-sorting protein [Sulfurovum sp.]MCB4773080.1 outer membrane lipoprotein-sorting protein [Sulfurovum sp.]
MKQPMWIKVAIVGILFSCTYIHADDARARMIMKKVDARDDGQTIQEDMQMILIDKSSKKRIRYLKSYSKDFGKDEYRILFFKSPADVKNTGFLTYDYDDSSKDDDQWLYLPALKKVKRIPTADKSGSFMGSDFSYFDMTDRDLEDYDFKLLKETKVRGKPAWVIEALPRNQRVVKESGYMKTIGIVRKDNYVVVRSISFLKNGKKKYMDIAKLHKQNGVWVSDEMTMITKKGKRILHKTILKFKNIKVNKPLPDSIFTTRRLEKGI